MHTRTSGNGPDTVGASAGPGSTGAGGAALERSRDELATEFRNLVTAGEALLRSTTTLSGEALLQAREQFRARLADARGRLNDVSRLALDRGRHAAGVADEYVHENPWPAIAVALLAGILAGVVVARR